MLLFYYYIVIVIIIIIIIIVIIYFMQDIYTYISETNYVPREYSIAAILLLLFMVLISLVSVLNLLYFYISTFRSMCAVTNMVVYYYYYYSLSPFCGIFTITLLNQNHTSRIYSFVAILYLQLCYM